MVAYGIFSHTPERAPSQLLKATAQHPFPILILLKSMSTDTKHPELVGNIKDAAGVPIEYESLTVNGQVNN